MKFVLFSAEREAAEIRVNRGWVSNDVRSVGQAAAKADNFIQRLAEIKRERF